MEDNGEDNSFRVIGASRCDCLRWKGMFIDTDQDTPSGSDHIFWCLTTQRGLGPDGKPVGKYECSAGRTCYRPF